MPTYDVPNVYIEEQTGPGVIAGAGTSTAAFIGPALRGPINEANRISSFDEFFNLYALSQSDGTFWPYINSPHWFFLAHAIRGFFENGGRQAYIIRVGTARAAAWDVDNQDGERVFHLKAKEEGIVGDDITVQVEATNATGAGGRAVVSGSARVKAVDGLSVTVDDPSVFQIGDIITKDESMRPEIIQIQEDVLTLSKTIAGLAVDDTLRIANILPTQDTFRLTDNSELWPGSVVKIKGDDADNPGTTVEEYAVVARVDRALGFITLAASPARQYKFNLSVAAADAPVLISQEFTLIITPPEGSAETFDNMSLSPLHPNYVFSAMESDWLRIVPPDAPPTAASFPEALVEEADPVTRTVDGRNDDPAALTATEYETGLNILSNIDDVNIVCVPDAAAHGEYVSIQKAMINHCLLNKDRFAILDSRLGSGLSGPGSVEELREQVEAERGFASLYYPWVEVREPIHPSRPRPIIPPRMFVPPSGHIAGVFARTDGEYGVHKAPANTDVRGVLGLERVLSDGQHGPLNLKGINVLRIFPGSGQVKVWGARTTVDPNITDWLYINIRRLMLYIEESIEEGIRWAVFDPNNLALWQKLKRTISEFLSRVWRDGALFGETADKAFYVRIDDALNPPSTRALGRLYIEIGVAPVRPAEFIIVRIGLWDSGSEITES